MGRSWRSSDLEPTRRGELREASADGRGSSEGRAVAPRVDGEGADGIGAAVALVLHREAERLRTEEGEARLVRFGERPVLWAIQHAERSAHRADAAFGELGIAGLATEVHVERREEALARVVPFAVGVHDA